MATEQMVEAENVQFMLDAIKLLLTCGDVEHAMQLIDAFSAEIALDTVPKQSSMSNSLEV